MINKKIFFYGWCAVAFVGITFDVVSVAHGRLWSNHNCAVFSAGLGRDFANGHVGTSATENFWSMAICNSLLLKKTIDILEIVTSPMKNGDFFHFFFSKRLPEGLLGISPIFIDKLMGHFSHQSTAAGPGGKFALGFGRASWIRQSQSTPLRSHHIGEIPSGHQTWQEVMHHRNVGDFPS